MWKPSWIKTVLPSSALLQAIVIFLTLLFGGIFDIVVGHILDFLNRSVASIYPFSANWTKGWNYIHYEDGVQEWALALEFVFLMVIATAIWYILNQANQNQRSVDALRELESRQNLIYSSEEVIQTLNGLPEKIAIELKKLDREQNNVTKTTSKPTKTKKTRKT